MGVSGVSGMAFGGPKHNILFVTATAIILDLKTGKPMQTIAEGSSLYKVTGLCAYGRKSTTLKIPALSCGKPLQ